MLIPNAETCEVRLTGSLTRLESKILLGEEEALRPARRVAVAY